MDPVVAPATMPKVPQGHYEAWLEDKLISKGPTFKEALEEAKARGVIEREELSFRWVRPKGVVCVY